MRVIVTRPAGQAATWVAELRARAIDAVALPLIGIAPVADAGPLRDAWRALPACRLVVFVSPNAAEHFFAARPASTAWPAATLAGSPGPGTTQALQRLGVPADRIVAPAADAAQLDSESLWAQLSRHDWVGARTLIVRGDGGREWLAETLKAHGASVETLPAYRREAPAWTAPERTVFAAATDRPGAHLWLFSSAEAIDHLQSLAVGAPAAAWPASRALASHPRIADRARRLGFGRVIPVAPSLAATVGCIQSLQP